MLCVILLCLFVARFKLSFLLVSVVCLFLSLLFLLVVFFGGLFCVFCVCLFLSGCVCLFIVFFVG